jgi:predicted methyltransferase
MLLPAVRAAPPAIAQTEINYLLGFIARSDCAFYRNGSWYDSKKAQAHLRSKYDILALRNQIDTAEDFIEKAATKSSLSDQAYKVRCPGGVAVTTDHRLLDELTGYASVAPMAHQAPSAPRHPDALRIDASASALSFSRPA